MAKKFFRKISIILVAAVLATSCHLSTLAIDETEMVELAKQETEQEGSSGTEGAQAAPAAGEETNANISAESELTQDASSVNNDAAESVVVEETTGQAPTEADTQAQTPDDATSGSNESGSNVIKDIVDNIVGSITDIVSGVTKEPGTTDETAESQSAAEAAPVTEKIIKIDTEITDEKTADDESSPSELPSVELTSEAVDGVIVTVAAPEGTFPADARLVVTKVAENNSDLEDIEAAVDNAKLVEDAQGESIDETDSEKERYTFDIKVVDNHNKEIQPENEISVKFALADSEKPIADANVYHLEENNEIKAAAQAAVLETALSGDTISNEGATVILDGNAELDGDLENDLGSSENSHAVKSNAEDTEAATVELKESSLIALPLFTAVNEETAQEVEAGTTGFSYYVVEFFYKEYKYVLAGDEEVELSAILDALEIKVDASTVTKVETSNPELFYATKSQATDSEASDSVWVVKSLKPFNTDEWMKVYVGDLCYEVKVTDAYGPVDIYRKDGTKRISGVTLAEAFEIVESDETIKLGADVEWIEEEEAYYSCKFHSEKKGVTLDLNNFRLNRVEIDVRNGSTLFVKDQNATSATSASNVSFFASGSKTEITIESGKFYNSISDLCALEADDGATINVNGGSIGIGPEENSQIMAKGGNIYIGGNTFVNVGADIYTSANGGPNSVIELNSTNYINTSISITAHTGKIIINSKINATKLEIDSGTELNVLGGSVSVTDSIKNSGTLEVNDGTITGKVTNSGTLEVNGGTFNSQVDNGNKDLPVGTLTVNGGTFNGLVDSWGEMEVCPTNNAVTFSNNIKFSGSNSVATLSSAIDYQLVCNGKMIISGGPMVVVNGGTYTRQSGNNFQVGTGKLIINGGKINNNSDGAFQNTDTDIVLNGGQYSMYEHSLSLVAYNRGQAIKTVFDGEKKVYEVVDQAEVGNRRCSLAEAFKYAKESGNKVVTLLGSIDKLKWNQDEIPSYTVPESITLDLAGNTLQCRSFSSMNAIVKDSSSPIIKERGLLKMRSSDNPVLDSSNGGYMPLKKGTEGYCFFKYSMANRDAYQLASSSNISCFPLVLQFGEEGNPFNYQAKAYEMIADPSNDCGLKLYSIVKLTKNGTTKCYKFQYSTGELFVLKGYMLSQCGQSSLKRLSVFYKVQNCQKGDKVEATFYVESSQTGFIASSPTQSWTYQ